MTVHVFTSAAANYLPKARVLFATLRRQRPDWRLHLALADDVPAEAARVAAGVDDVLALADLGIPEWRRWTFCHSLVELATAIKPFALARLLARPDCGAVLYLDPDIAVFSALEDVFAAFETADILLTPHQTAPEKTVPGVIANEVCTLQHGIYNLGFVGVAARAEGRAFADWWGRRTFQFCREDVPNGLYTDQRWIDLVPAFFDAVKVLRGAHLNVGPWNLGVRQLTGRAPDALQVDGRPLGFFHFSGVDGGGLEAFAGQDAVAELARWYAREAAARASDPSAPHGWAFGAFADCEPVAREQRLVYRLRGDLQAAFPDPFASGEGTYQAWWRGQAPLEFPALFDPAARGAELARLNGALTTGFADLMAS